MEYLKKASNSAEQHANEARKVVEGVLKDIRERGEDAVRDLARKFDHWDQDFVLSPEKKARLIASIPENVKDDIRFAYEQITTFARAQRESIKDFEIITPAGVRAGQKVIPMDTVGCYIPGGRFAHTCSALMSIATAKVAGVKHIIAATPPRGDSIDPSVCFAMDLAGADIILEMGGIQSIATLAYGLFTGHPANMIAGPGNAFVAEAKAMLQGYKNVLKASGIKVEETLIYHVNNNIEGGYIGMKKMIGNLPKKPDAVFASSDEIAFGAIDALKEMKLRIPEDVAVAGFGNDRMSSLMEPKVTTVELPYRKMGIYGARMLFDQIEEKQSGAERRLRPKKIQLQTKMRVRKSCGHSERIGEMF